MPRTKRIGKPSRQQSSQGGQAWLTDLAKQLDGVIEEDPQKRSAGKLIIRSLLREAVKGNVRAIKECIRLAEKSEKVSLSPMPPSLLPTRGRGRPAKGIDLVSVQRLARLGMRDATKIGRCLGIPKQTLLGPKHAEQVKEAFENGRAEFELDALTEYADDIAHSRRNPLVIFKMKQLGWTDKVHAIQSDALLQDAAGARERLKALIELKRRLKAEAASEAAPASDANSGDGGSIRDDETP